MNIRKILAVAASLTAVVLMTGCSSNKTIDPMDYFEVSYYGYDGEAVAYASFDYNLFENDLLSENYSEEAEWDVYKMEWLLEEKLNYSLDESSDLSNGDEITLVINYEKDLLDDYGYTLKGDKTQTITVSGLEEYIPPEEIVIDAFAEDGILSEDGLMVTFWGISPNCGIDKVYNNFPEDDIRSQVIYSVSDEDRHNYSIKKGDTVTIVASLPYSLTKVSEDNTYYVLKDETYEVPCTGVQSYVTSLDDISSEEWEMLIAQSNVLKDEHLDVGKEDVWMNTYYILGGNHSLRDVETIDNIYFDKAYLVAVRDGESADWWTGTFNMLYITYHVTLHNLYGEDYEEATWVVYVKNICLDEDDNLIFNPEEDLKIEYIQPTQEYLTAFLENAAGDNKDITSIDLSGYN